MVRVPKGEFIMGSDRIDTEAKALQYGSSKPWFANERPERKVFVDEFFIDKYEVTNAEYAKFVEATKIKPPRLWPGGRFPEGKGKNPVSAVSWFKARDYCKWKGKRLPTEAEWEKAARGTDGRIFPWGNKFDIKKLNALGEHSGTTPVGSFPEGKSPYGAFDMAGNLLEWTADWYKPYPGNTLKDEDYGEKFRVVRGGGWGGLGHYTLQVYLTTPFRRIAPPKGAFNDVGFRCAKDG